MSNTDANIPEITTQTDARTAWVLQGLCLTTDPDKLFVRGAAQRKAAAMCRDCPVKPECLADALDNEVEFGVWGGMTERQRRALLKEHPEVVSWSDFFAARRRRAASGARGAASGAPRAGRKSAAG
jgi:WhiB family transcriptional regulator, redox-sensing transcriptional regulator